jgi:hypothetical protein
MSFRSDEHYSIGMPALQLCAGVSSFETISPAFKSDQSWRLKFVPLVPLSIFKLIIKNIWKLSFGTPFKTFVQLWLDKGLASLLFPFSAKYLHNIFTELAQFLISWKLILCKLLLLSLQKAREYNCNFVNKKIN